MSFDQVDQIARDQLADGQILISTIAFPGSMETDGLPYESLVVVQEDWRGTSGNRWSSLQAAQQGHQDLVAKWTQAKRAYCLDCAHNPDTENQWAWIMGDGTVFCNEARNGLRDHLACVECLPQDHCDQHPNWCAECAPGEICELHRVED